MQHNAQNTHATKAAFSQPCNACANDIVPLVTIENHWSRAAAATSGVRLRQRKLGNRHADTVKAVRVLRDRLLDKITNNCVTD